MPNLHSAKAYLRYRKNSVTKHGVHSPFVFELITKVFPPKKNEDFENHPAEKWRGVCLNDHSEISVTDFGTGTSGKRKTSSIAKKSAKAASEGQLLHRIVKHFQPKKMLELGTSLGITTLYEATAVTFEKFISLEGCPEIAEKAKSVFTKNNLDIEVAAGEFDSTLKTSLENLKSVDYVFFDGNHREEPTLKYFETCLPFAHNDSVFIFDDIHWSEEMERAWEKIKLHPKVTVTIDVFYFGIVFFRREQVKEDFVLRY